MLRAFNRETPHCIVEDNPYVLVTAQLAGIDVKELGPVIADLPAQRQAIMVALNLLFTGI